MKLQPDPLKIEGVNWLKIIIPILLITIIIIVVLIGLDYTNDPAFCANCHAMQTYVKSWTKGKHKKTSCTDCHQEPGVIGALVQRTGIARNYGLMSIYFQRQRPTLASSISVAGCLRCHENIKTDTIRTALGVRVSHKEIIAAGLSCGRCHLTVAHFSRAVKAGRPVHDYCFSCHQDQTASQECSFCHTRDIGDKGADQIDNYRKVELRLNKCDGCHSTDSCKSCHPEGRELQVF